MEDCREEPHTGNQALEWMRAAEKAAMLPVPTVFSPWPQNKMEIHIQEA